jgi:hypothetical protein
MHIASNEEYGMRRKLMARAGYRFRWLTGFSNQFFFPKYEQLMKIKINVEYASFRGLISTEQMEK